MKRWDDGFLDEERQMVRGLTILTLIFAAENDGRIPSLTEIRDFTSGRLSCDFNNITYLPSGTEILSELPGTFVVAILLCETGAWVSRINGKVWKIDARKGA